MGGSGYSGERISARLSRTGSGDHLTLSSDGPDGSTMAVDGAKDETYVRALPMLYPAPPRSFPTPVRQNFRSYFDS